MNSSRSGIHRREPKKEEKNELIITQSAKRTFTNKQSTSNTQEKAAENYFAGSFRSTKTLALKETKPAKKSVKKSRTSTVDSKSGSISIETPQQKVVNSTVIVLNMP